MIKAVMILKAAIDRIVSAAWNHYGGLDTADFSFHYDAIDRAAILKLERAINCLERSGQ